MSGAPKIIIKFPKKRDPTQLDQNLEKILQSLRQKDTYGFFAEPVDTTLVPDYLSVIKFPMDFSTMEKKLKNGEYTSWEDFEKDFTLVVRNCKTYNLPTTPYYKAADKLETFGNKLLARESQKLKERSHSPAPSQSQGLPSGVSTPTSAAAASPKVAGTKHSLQEDDIVDIVSNPASSFRVPLITSPESQASTPAPPPPKPAPPLSKYMRKKLEMKQMVAMKQAEGAPPVFSSLKRARYDTDGSLLHSVALKEVSISATPPLAPQFTPTMATMFPHPVSYNKKLQSPFHLPGEEKKHPIMYLEYDPYSSFGPVLDSTKIASFLSQEESDFLAVTYGDVVGEAYMNSLEQFAKDSPTEVKNYIEKLLDVISVGGHRVLKSAESGSENQEESGAIAAENLAEKIMDEMELSLPGTGLNLLEEIDKVKQFEKTTGRIVKSDENTLSQTVELLKEKGVDLSFLLEPIAPQAPPGQFYENPVYKNPTKTPTEKIQAFLDDNAKFIAELQRMQNERFAKGSAEKLSQREQDIATRLRSRLLSFLEHIPPKSLISKKALQIMMPFIQPNDPIFMGTLPVQPPARLPPPAQQRPPQSAGMTPAQGSLTNIRPQQH